MENKICTGCNTEKHINNFYKKFSECEACNIVISKEVWNDTIILKIKYQFTKNIL